MTTPNVKFRVVKKMGANVAKVTKTHRDKDGFFLVDELRGSDGHVYTPSKPRSESIYFDRSFKFPYHRVYVEEAANKPTKMAHYDANNFYYVFKYGKDDQPLSDDAFLNTLHNVFVQNKFDLENVPARPAGWCPKSIEPAVGSCRTTMPASGSGSSEGSSKTTSESNTLQWILAALGTVCSLCIGCCVVLGILLLR